MTASSRLDSFLAAGRAAWPSLSEAPELLADLLEEGSKLEHAGDLYLAAACAAGSDDALRAFRDRYDGHLRAILGALDVPDDIRREARQTLEIHLFVAADGAEPRIRRYRGRGTLLAFLRVAAVRMARGLLRGHRRRGEISEDALDPLAGPTLDPELAYLKRLYRAEFARAFRTGLEALETRDRTLLRYSLVDQLSIDKLAALYGIHRSTVARHIARARERLVATTQQALRDALEVDDDTLASILRLCESSADVSARRLLAESERPMKGP